MKSKGRSPEKSQSIRCEVCILVGGQEVPLSSGLRLSDSSVNMLADMFAPLVNEALRDSAANASAIPGAGAIHSASATLGAGEPA